MPPRALRRRLHAAARREAGAGSVLVLALVAGVLLLTGLTLPLNQALTLRQRVANAADAGALAAADTASGFAAGHPCENAARAALLHGVELGECALDGLQAQVTAVGHVLGIAVRVTARAGPPPGAGTIEQGAGG